MSSIQISPVDPTSLNTARPFLQTAWWAAFKARHGWSGLAFRVQWERGEFPLSVLLRRMPLGLTLAYVPHGPEDQDFLEGAEFQDRLRLLSLALRPHMPQSTVCLRWDLLTGTRVAVGGALELEADEDEPRSTDPLPQPLTALFGNRPPTCNRPTP